MAKMFENKILMTVFYFGIGFSPWFVAYTGWSLGSQDINLPSFWFAYIMGLIALGLTPVTKSYGTSPLWGVVGMAYACAYRFNPTPNCIAFLTGALVLFMIISKLYRMVFPTGRIRIA